MYTISDEVIKFIEKTRGNWRVEVIPSERSLAEVKIQSGIFQGGAISITICYSEDDTQSLIQVMCRWIENY